jgi:hypothetical protein
LLGFGLKAGEESGVEILARARDRHRPGEAFERPEMPFQEHALIPQLGLHPFR